MKKIIFTFICIISINISLFAQWIQKEGMYNYGRRGGISGALNGKGYAGLGAIYNYTYVNDFWEYDTLTNTWMQKANYPGAGLIDATSFVVNGKFYIGLGYDELHFCHSDLWEYNPSADKWVQKATFPGTARRGAGAFVLGDSVFVVAGSYDNGNDYLNDMYMFNPITNKWKQKADFAGGSRAWGAAFSVNGFGYYGLGATNNTYVNNDFWKYNPVTDSWSSIPNFAGSERCTDVSLVINNNAYVGFGIDIVSNTIYNDLGKYDPVSNSWQHISTPLLERTACTSFSFGDIAYIGGGWNNIDVYTDLWAFDPTILNYLLEKKNNRDLLIYPNPTNNYITIKKTNTEAERYFLSFTTIEGKSLISKEIIFNDKYKLNLSDLDNGLYFLSLQNDRGNVVEKIVVQK